MKNPTQAMFDIDGTATINAMHPQHNGIYYNAIATSAAKKSQSGKTGLEDKSVNDDDEAQQLSSGSSNEYNRSINSIMSDEDSSQSSEDSRDNERAAGSG
jgi:hypothetical protein